MVTRAGFDIGYVGPNQLSNHQISAGTYSLSARSTVPFVTFIGASGFTKTFSWGEIVVVPDGEAITVQNSSFHGGDIYINSGCDYDNRPARITVPVPVTEAFVLSAGFDPGISGTYPVDTRMARRAFWVPAALKNSTGDGFVYVIGQVFQGSHNTESQLAPIPGAGFVEIHQIPLNTNVAPIPLGKRAVYGMADEIPHTLLTAGRAVLIDPAEWDGDTAAIVTNSYYVLEY